MSDRVFLNEGIDIGVGQGENRLAKLIQILLKEEKIEEISLVTKDIKERQRLYKLYNIIEDDKKVR